MQTIYDKFALACLRNYSNTTEKHERVPISNRTYEYLQVRKLVCVRAKCGLLMQL